MATKKTSATTTRTAVSAPAKNLPAREAYPSFGEVASVARQAGGVARELAQGMGMRAAPGSRLATNLTGELNSIDFRKMIGGPLQAAVDAQVASSLATINFIKEVGFQPIDPNTPGGKKELVMVDFTHTKKDVDANGAEISTEKTIKVPLLAMLQIPSLRIEHLTIDFNVKLNSVEKSDVSDQLDIGAELKGGWGPVSLKVTVAYQRKTATGIEVKKEYGLNVNVKAVQDEIPAGLEKILNLLAAD